MTLLFLTSNSIQAQTDAALNFDGTNDYVNCTNLAALNSTAQFTAEAWVTTTVGTGARRIMSKGGDFEILLFDPNNIQCRVKNGTDSYGYTTSNPLASVNTWVHVACVFDGSQTGNANRLKIYINGVLQTLTFSGTIPATVATNASTLNLGSAGGTASYWSGNMDEVRLWSVARTQAQIQASMNTELCGSTTGLVAYYNFNQGTAAGTNTGITALTNSSPTTGLNGTLTNFALTGATSNWITSSNGVATATFVNSNTAATTCLGTAALSVNTTTATDIKWYNSTTLVNTASPVTTVAGGNGSGSAANQLNSPPGVSNSCYCYTDNNDLYRVCHYIYTDTNGRRNDPSVFMVCQR
jgi:hypothetical protein